MGGKSRDGGKGLADPVRHVAYAKFAHSGRVDEKYAVHIDELPMRGGVPSLDVEDAYLPGAHDLLPDQCVHQGGFANAGLAE